MMYLDTTPETGAQAPSTSSGQALSVGLREYQLEILRQLPVIPGARTLATLPTGAGKTAIAVEWLRRRATRERPGLFIVHKEELLRQTIDALLRAGFSADELGLIAASLREYRGVAARPDARVQCAMIWTLNNRDTTAPAYVVIDEAHHTAAESWKGLAKRWPKAEFLGLTATPCRLDMKPLGRFFQKLICGPSTRDLIDQGWLSPFVHYLGVQPDLSDVTTLGGEFNAGEAGETMVKHLMVTKPWEAWHKHNVQGPALAFLPTIAASKAFVEKMVEHGIRAEHVDFETPNRDEVLKRWDRGGIQLFSNVALFVEGLDCPSVEAIFLLRPTMSLAIYRQMVGRGLRVSPDGRPVRIFDHAGCAPVHGLIDTDIDWSLSKKLSKHMKRAPQLRTCEECGAVITTRLCPHCGHFHDHEARVVAVAGGMLDRLAGPPSPDHVSLAEFALMENVSAQAIYFRVRRGMPSQGGWIVPAKAREWSHTRRTMGQRVRYQDPTYRDRQAAGVRAATQKPEWREKMRARNTDPEFKAKLKAGRTAAREHRAGLIPEAEIEARKEALFQRFRSGAAGAPAAPPAGRLLAEKE